MKGFFVTGTDTEIGKTYCTCLLLKHIAANGLNACGLKPIASGCTKTDDGLRNDDALAIQSASNIELSYSLINRYAFEPAIAPHIAAAQTNTHILFDDIHQDAAEVSKLTDYLIVEGAGGWKVPLSDPKTHPDSDMAGLAVRLGLPVIMVVGVRLGCINHAQLTLESIQHSGAPLAGWIANHINAETLASQENVATLKQLLKVPMIAEVGYQQLSLTTEVDLLAC